MTIYPDETKDLDNCSALGTIVSGLYFLREEAKRASMDDLCSILDSAIVNSLDQGSLYMREKVTTLQTSINNNPTLFVDNFIATNDVTVKSNLKELWLKKLKR